MEPTRSVIIHGKDLDIKEISICDTTTVVPTSNSSCTNIDLKKSVVYDELREFYIINMNNNYNDYRECVKGRNYTLNIKYVGQISDALAGFYRSSYTDASGNIN